jgi:hypothetical protein
MFVFYNGYQLNLVKTNSFSESPEYSDDGTDYLWTKFTIDVTCIFAPGATAVNFFGQQLVQYDPAFPIGADTTTANLKEALLVPRRALIYQGEHSRVITSPPFVQGVQSGVDCKNGPRVIDCTVTKMAGSHSWWVNWKCETWLTNCPGIFSTQFPPIVSNRWSNEQTIDEDLRTTISMDGTTIFRADYLEALGVSNNFNFGADYWRAALLPPCPLGFKRKETRVQVDPLGTTLRWHVTDEEQPVNIGSLLGKNVWGVTRFEATYGQNTIRAGEGNAVGPAYITSLDAAAWGHPKCSRKNLLIFLSLMAIEKLGLTPPIGNPRAKGSTPIVRSISIREALHERMIQLHVEVWNVVPPGQNGQVSRTLNPAALGTELAMLANDGTNPNPPFDNGTRGFYFGQMFTQALQYACVQPVPPIIGVCGQGNSGPGSVLVGDNFTVTCAPIPDAPGTIPQNGPNLSNARNLQGGITQQRVDIRRRRRNGRRMAGVAGLIQIQGGIMNGSGGIGGIAGLGIPVATAQTQPEFLQLVGPTEIAEVHWEAERLNNIPAIPELVLNDPNYVTLDYDLDTVSPIMVTPDGDSAVYHVEGTYFFGMQLALNPLSDPIPMGANPAFSLPYEINFISPDDFSSGIIDFTT